MCLAPLGKASPVRPQFQIWRSADVLHADAGIITIISVMNIIILLLIIISIIILIIIICILINDIIKWG